MQTFRLNLRLQCAAVFGGILLILSVSVGAFGQLATGTIKGQVTDEFGGVIVGASVVAVDASGAKKTATTNGEGNFAINGLTPGKYSFQVTAPGFATFENTEIDLTSTRSQQLNVTLKV